ncbi:hypothetical protein Taro_010056 [Colocasia esculenta]|uniref:Glycosyltransferase n=1 Tax=Colocasia esculenta TaxID=4460 RepID=A0A843U6M3_COLES|nr:hypothetical protein [Colocasia esculenta]
MDPAPRHLVALPIPGRGHVNPMLNLCEHLLARDGDRLLISFVVTEEWLGLLGPAAAAAEAAVSPRHTGLRFRTLPNVIPSEHNRGADLKGFNEAIFTRMEGPFEELLGGLRREEGEGEPPVRGIISDTFLPWAVAVGNRREIPVYSLFTQSASYFSVLYYLHLLPPGAPLNLTVFEEPDESLDFIPGITSLKMGDIQSIYSLDKTLNLVRDIFSRAAKAQCLLFTSFYELESRAMDALNSTLPFPIYPAGPSIPYTANMSAMPIPESCYYSWLDSQPRGSVLYVSLGSFMFVSNEQMDEIARGLCASGVSFLWVARQEAARMQELGGGAGLVVPWCDQLKVLCHPAVGGFLTHCGWNSILEAVYAGVPMLTFPIAWDQPANSRLIVDEWKTGLSLKGEAAGDSRVVGREEIARTVQRLMDSEGEESKELRRRAGELKEACRRVVQVDGSSTVGLDAFIAHMETGN